MSKADDPSVFGRVRDDGDVCSLGKGGQDVATDGQRIGIGRVKVEQPLALLIDGSSSSDVDEEGDEDDDPSRVACQQLRRPR